MTGEFTEQAYPDDIVGELCDNWRSEGLTFEVDEVGTPIASPAFEHDFDLSFFKTVNDSYGAQQLYLDSGFNASLARIVRQLPLRHVVYRSDETKPGGKVRHGIKLESLPAVRELIEQAETAIPAGTQVYRPQNKVVTSEKTKQATLKLLDDAMTPAEVKRKEQSIYATGYTNATAVVRESHAQKEQLLRRELAQVKLENRTLQQRKPAKPVETQLPSVPTADVLVKEQISHAERRLYVVLSKIGFITTGATLTLSADLRLEDAPLSSQLFMAGLAVTSGAVALFLDKASRE